MPSYSAQKRIVPDDLVPVVVAAKHVTVCDRTIRRWIVSGELRAYRVGGRLIRVSLADLDKLIRPVPAAKD